MMVKSNKKPPLPPTTPNNKKEEIPKKDDRKSVQKSLNDTEKWREVILHEDGSVDSTAVESKSQSKIS